MRLQLSLIKLTVLLVIVIVAKRKIITKFIKCIANEVANKSLSRAFITEVYCNVEHIALDKTAL